MLRTGVDMEVPKRKPTVRERMQRFQAAFAPNRAVEGSVVDEVIAERRVGAWKGTLEAHEDLTTGRAAEFRERVARFIVRDQKRP